MNLATRDVAGLHDITVIVELSQCCRPSFTPLKTPPCMRREGSVYSVRTRVFIVEEGFSDRSVIGCVGLRMEKGGLTIDRHINISAKGGRTGIILDMAQCCREARQRLGMPSSPSTEGRRGTRTRTRTGISWWRLSCDLSIHVHKPLASFAGLTLLLLALSVEIGIRRTNLQQVAVP